MIICIMCPIMSLIATILFKNAGSQFVAVWLQTTFMNFPVAFFWQLMYCGPLIRFSLGNVSGEIKKIWDLMDTSYDKFIRTTDEDHEKQVQKIFKKLYDQGDIYKGHYEGMYCTPCESFFTESQLVDGKCPDCGREVQPAKEEAYFFKMSKYADRLIEHINTHPEFIQPVSRKTR